MSELELIRRRYVRYLVVSLVLVALALLLTYVAAEVRSLWLMILALSILLASFGLMLSGLTLRTEYRAMKETGWKSMACLKTIKSTENACTYPNVNTYK